MVPFKISSIRTANIITAIKMAVIILTTANFGTFIKVTCTTYSRIQQNVRKFLRQFEKFVKILFFEIYLFNLFYNNEKYFKFLDVLVHLY